MEDAIILAKEAYKTVSESKDKIVSFQIAQLERLIKHYEKIGCGKYNPEHFDFYFSLFELYGAYMVHTETRKDGRSINLNFSQQHDERTAGLPTIKKILKQLFPNNKVVENYSDDRSGDEHIWGFTLSPLTGNLSDSEGGGVSESESESESEGEGESESESGSESESESEGVGEGVGDN